jgi:ribosomal protein L30/L7E
MLLTEDYYTPTWKRLKKALTERLQELREINDSVQAELKTAAIRGQIAEVKKMLALGPQPTAGDEADPA